MLTQLRLVGVFLRKGILFGENTEEGPHPGGTGQTDRLACSRWMIVRLRLWLKGFSKLNRRIIELSHTINIYKIWTHCCQQLIGHGSRWQAARPISQAEALEILDVFQLARIVEEILRWWAREVPEVSVNGNTQHDHVWMVPGWYAQ